MIIRSISGVKEACERQKLFVQCVFMFFWNTSYIDVYILHPSNIFLASFQASCNMLTVKSFYNICYFLVILCLITIRLMLYFVEIYWEGYERIFLLPLGKVLMVIVRTKLVNRVKEYVIMLHFRILRFGCNCNAERFIKFAWLCFF